jgi:hypothetical protein
LHLLLSLSTRPPSASSSSASPPSSSSVPPPMVLALLEAMGLASLVQHTWLFDAISGYTTEGALSNYKVPRQ